MAVFKAFNGLLPGADNAAEVSAPPYDVLNTEEAAALAEGKALSFLRVSRPEIELPPGTDVHSNEVYQKASSNFRRLCKHAPLVRDRENHLYLYRLTMGGHVQTGIAGTASADDYCRDIIKKHEKTRRDKEDDRTRHLLELRSHTGPVFLTYKDNTRIDQICADIASSSPLFDFTAPDGIRHEFWRIPAAASAELSGVFDSIPELYIADGHHRAASAARVAAKLAENNPGHDGSEDYNFFLAVAFPGSQLKILPYNRVVFDLNGLDPGELKKRISEKFEVSPTDDPKPSSSGIFCMYLKGLWHQLKPRFDISGLGVTGSLDVSVLQDYILLPLLGIDDPRTSRRIDFVGGIRGTSELERRVDSGECAVAFSMYPTTLRQLMDIADAGEVMPPKSTWFEPKLRDGLVCHDF